MGWRASTLRDLIVVVLVRHGPHSIKQLGERLSRGALFEEWRLLYGPNWPEGYWGDDDSGERVRRGGPSPVGYTDLYQRLKTLEKAGKVVQADERGQWNAIVWRAISRDDVAARQRDLETRLIVPADLRDRAEAHAARIGCTVEFVVGPETPFDRWDRGVLALVTPRGRVEVGGPPDQSWYDAAIEVGLL